MKNQKNLSQENAELKARLAEAEELLAAIKSGEVDAFVTDDQKIFTLKSADHAYRVLVETINEGAATLSFDGTVMYCNSRMADMLGLPMEKIIGGSIFDFVGPDELPKLKSLLRQSKKKNARAEFQFKKNASSFLPVLVSCNSLKLDGVGLCMVVTDLTEQKNAELELKKHRDHLEEIVKERTEQLSESENKFKLIATNTPDHILVQDADLRYILVVNPQLGLTEKDMIGKTDSDILSKEDAANLMKIKKRVLRTGNPEHLNTPIVSPKGDAQYFEGSYIPRRNLQGKIDGIIGYFRNVTERKKTEDALLRSEALYRGIGESIDYGVWVCAPDGRNTYASESFLKMVGITQEQCSNFGWGNVLHPDDAERTIAAWQECVRIGGNWDIEHRFHGVDGQWHHVLARGVPVRNERGQIICWAGINLDISRLKRAEEMLRKSEERIKLVLESSSVGTFEVDFITGEGQWNAVEFTLLGLQPGSVPAGPETFFRYVHPDDIESLRTHWEEALQTGNLDTEFRIVRPDGEERWLAGRGRFNFDGKTSGDAPEVHGRAIRFLGVNYDITERKRAETAKQDILQRFYHMFSSMYAGILLMTDEGRVEFANQAFCDYYGLKETPEDMVGMTSRDLLVKIKSAYLHPEETADRIREIIRLGQPVKGEEFAMQGGHTAMRDFVPLSVHGKPYGRLWIHIDITDRKRAEEALMKTSKNLSESQKIAHLGSFEYDADTRTTIWSEEEFNIYGLDPAGPSPDYEVMLAKHIHPDDAAVLNETFTSAMHNGSTYELEHRIVRPDGSVRFVYDRAHPFFDSNGRLVRYIGATLDITERKKADEILKRDKDALEKLVKERSQDLIDSHMQLERAKRLSDIGTLAATVAHELRNPLAAMSMSTAIIKRDPSKDMVERQLKNVEKMIWESNQIIDNLLSYSRLRSPRYEICELHAILMECLEIHKQQHTKKKILFKTHLDPEANMTMADPIQMREVFNNLLNNASDAVPAVEGQIEIQVHDVGDDIEIIIGDNGPGIDVKIVDKVFDPFFSTKTKGTGLGLSVCKQIVNMHDGEIEMRSKPALGTSVIVRLPKKNK